jgi:hypothetical protein
MSRLDSITRIALSFPSSLEASRNVYPSEAPEARCQRTRALRQRQRAAGMTEIILVLPKSCVDQLDAQKSRQGLRNRSQVVEKMLTNERGSDQPSS